ARAEARARVAVEVLEEEDEVAPVRIALESLGPAIDGAAPVAAFKEDPRQPLGELPGHACERELPARSGRTLDREVVPVVPVKSPQRLHDQVVDRKPDGPAPVRVAAE